MVVVPTSHDVTLSYGRSAADDLGDVATVAGVVLLVALFVVPPLRRRRRRASGRGRHVKAGAGSAEQAARRAEETQQTQSV